MRKLVLRTINVFLWVAAIGLIGNIVRLSGNTTSSLAAPNLTAATVTPFTVVLKETMVASSGVRVDGPTSTFAMRSDGATVTYGPSLDGGRVLTLPSGFHVLTNEKIRAKSSTPIRTHVGDWVRDSSQDCIANLEGKPASQLGERVLGTENVGGLRTVKVGTDEKHGLTSWYALDHSCAQVRVHMRFREGGASELDLVELSPGEPPEELFNVEGYVEGPPSRLGPSVPTESQRHKLEVLDRVYHERRRALGPQLPSARVSINPNVPR